MRDALLKIDRTILYSLCEWGQADVKTWGNETGNSWRMSGDITGKWFNWYRSGRISGWLCIQRIGPVLRKLPMRTASWWTTPISGVTPTRTCWRSAMEILPSKKAGHTLHFGLSWSPLSSLARLYVIFFQSPILMARYTNNYKSSIPSTTTTWPFWRTSIFLTLTKTLLLADLPILISGDTTPTGPLTRSTQQSIGLVHPLH